MLALLVVLLAGCGGPAEKATTSLYDFVEVAEDAGLDFRHTSGAAGDWFLVETMGAGAAFVDYDRDGWLDVYLADGFDLAPWRGKLNPINQMAVDSTGYWVSVEYEPPLRYSGGVDSTVYMLRQEPAATLNRLYHNGGGVFAEVEAGAADSGYGMGVAVGDYDNDGWPDIYVTNYGPNALYRNEAGRYTAAVGLD
ncbi:MAG: VCBS repeat-containing protein, partial [Candidatus Latescibacteria bacterium]|nr:VCBS repeat-containing protein [Candidatus Latescibacterota bacterium]